MVTRCIFSLFSLLNRNYHHVYLPLIYHIFLNRAIFTPLLCEMQLCSIFLAFNFPPSSTKSGIQFIQLRGQQVTI